MNIKIDWFNAGFAGVVLVVLALLPFLNPCETEDGSVCTWNAQEQGNGQGTSYIDFYGITIYKP